MPASSGVSMGIIMNNSIPAKSASKMDSQDRPRPIILMRTNRETIKPMRKSLESRHITSPGTPALPRVKGRPATLPPMTPNCMMTLQTVTGSIASERIDALIGMVFHLSRSAAKEKIEQELVFAGGLPVKSVSYTPRVGESISVRGYGKFIYLGTENRTKKGRLIAKAERFV